jgi:glycerol-3-phosphate acyltransferase PlsX
LYGNKTILEKEINKKKLLKNNCQVIHTNTIISDEESPLNAAKKGKESSMWKSIESQKENKTDISLSAGNTGALLVISRLLFDTIEGINKPALAALWPNQNNMNVVLDLGANIECNEKNLVDFSIMGTALFKSLFNIDCPKVALLNVGLEEIKGNDVLKKTFSLLKNSKSKNFDFSGYIEGNQIMNGDVDVIVTDGFTGNIALKTAEGTANFITNELKKIMLGTLLGKISSFININNIRSFKKRLDPRLYNGAILLGLDSPVVKSHGSTDSLGFSNSLNMCENIIKGNLIDKIKQSID